MPANHIVVNLSSVSGDQTLVTAPTGQVVKVVSFLLQVSAGINLTWKDGSSALSGAMATQAGGWYGVGADKDGHMAASTALVLNVSAASDVRGYVNVRYE